MTQVFPRETALQFDMGYRYFWRKREKLGIRPAPDMTGVGLHKYTIEEIQEYERKFFGTE